MREDDGELKEIPRMNWKPEEKDTSGMERITGAYPGGFGSYGNGASNFIEIYIETNKNYNEKNIWEKHKNQDEIINSLTAKCKELKNGN